MKKIIHSIIFICFILFLSNNLVSSLTANSSNYSVSMFGSGVQASSSNSANFQTHSVTLTGAATRNSENSLYTANIGFFANTSYNVIVSITSYSISPKSAVIGSTIGLSISALNSQDVWAVITSPNNQQQTLQLINNQFVYYLPAPSVVGRYNITFYANSSTGTFASAIDYFELTQTAPPVSTTIIIPGGGGGTTIQKCSYIWDCTPWSLCSEGKQTRTCDNIGTCTGNDSKPREEMKCSEALFDIILNISDIKLTENQTLKFRVGLIEKIIDTEEIDVHIKYSIIDSNNNEIFSQIETKGINQSLDYEKELTDIKLNDGDYILRVDILYGNLQRAFAEQKFTISKNKGLEIKKEFDFSKIIKSAGIYAEIIGGILILLAAVLLIRKLILFLGRKILPILKRRISAAKKTRELNNRASSLIGKEIYSSDRGEKIGKIKDVFIEKNKISKLGVELANELPDKVRKVLINYHHVKSVGEIVVVQGIDLNKI